MFQRNFETALSKYENTGSRLEDEFVGTVNSRKYKEMAYALLHKDELNFDSLSNDERIEKTIGMKEAAAKDFDGPADFINDNYIRKSEAMRLVEKCQVGNPEKPNKFFASKLYNAVKDRFSEKDFTLKFFTAAGGTHLDVAHKIDCFLKLYIKQTEREVACATIDLTQNSRKKSANADIIVIITDEEKDQYDPSRENKNYQPEILQDRITEISEQVVNALIEDYQKRVQ